MYNITILGATSSSLYLAILLAKEGFSVCILEQRRTIGDAQDLRHIGFANPSLLDNFWRLSIGLGEQPTKAIFAFMQRSLSILSTLTTPSPSVSWMLARDEREQEELDKQHQLLQQWGYHSHALSAKDLSTHFPSNQFVGGYTLPMGRCFSPVQLLSKLQKEARSLGVHILSNIEMTKIDDHCGGVQIICTQEELRKTINTDILIYCQHEQLPLLDPFFQDSLGSIRTQSIAYTRSTNVLPVGCSAQYGYLKWCDRGQERILSGCRWASPHFEIGESDDSTLVPAIESALITTAQDCFLEENVVPNRSWSVIERRSCDGLPLVGAIPGRDHYISCTAFHGQIFSLGLAAAESTAQFLLHGESSTLPLCFSPRRLI